MGGETFSSPSPQNACLSVLESRHDNQRAERDPVVEGEERGGGQSSEPSPKFMSKRET